MINEQTKQSLSALNQVTRICLEKNEFTVQDLQDLLVCCPNLLEGKIYTRVFLRWLGRMAVLPQVLQEAGIFAWALRKFSNVVSKW